ncbi:MAG: hypothetical protein KGM42_00200 [Hyphomicrobiales bacterium]|nr:hypothetical protein [Hyphomicrobiales bacterium]
MRKTPDHQYVCEVSAPQFTVGEIALPLALLGGVLVVGWLDTVPLQIFGTVLYPVEWLLNAAMFPDAVTPLRGNGTALLVLAPTTVLAATVFALWRLAWIALRGGARRLVRRRA